MAKESKPTPQAQPTVPAKPTFHKWTEQEKAEFSEYMKGLYASGAVEAPKWTEEQKATQSAKLKEGYATGKYKKPVWTEEMKQRQREKMLAKAEAARKWEEAQKAKDDKK